MTTAQLARFGAILTLAAVAGWAVWATVFEERVSASGSPGAPEASMPVKAQEDERALIAATDAKPARSSLAPENTRPLTVSVQAAPGAPFEPLARGWVELELRERRQRVKVTGGVASLSASAEEEVGMEVVAVRSHDDQPLWFDPDEVDSGAAIRCFAFPGFFVQATLGSALPMEGWKFGSASGIDCQDMLATDPALGESVDCGRARTHFVPLDEDVDRYLFRVPGRAWTCIRAADLEPGATVGLSDELAGSVSFELHSKIAAERWLLVVNSARGTVQQCEANAAASRVLEGFPVGSYQAYLSAGRDHGRHLAVSEVVAFSVEPGSRTNVVLIDLEEASESNATGSLRGVLAFEAWDLVAPWYERFGLTLHLRGTTKATLRADSALPSRERVIPTARMEVLSAPESGNPAWAWHREAVPVGRYALEIEPIGVTIEFEIVANSTTVIDEPVADLAVMRLSFSRPVEDLEALAPLLQPRESEPRLPGMLINSPLLRKDANVALMMASAGTYTLGFFVGPNVVSRDVDLQPGWNEISIDLPVDRSVTLRFVDEDGDPMPWERGTWDAISFSSTDGQELDANVLHVRRGDFRGFCSALLDLPMDGVILIHVDPLSQLALAESTLNPRLGETTDVVVMHDE